MAFTRLADACDARGGVLVVSDRDSCIWFASHQVVCFFEDGAPRCRLTAIAVDEVERGRGAGRALIDAVEARAVAGGCTMLEATSAHRAERAAAHLFYPSLDFPLGDEETTYYVRPIVTGTSG